MKGQKKNEILPGLYPFAELGFTQFLGGEKFQSELRTPLIKLFTLYFSSTFKYFALIFMQ